MPIAVGDALPAAAFRVMTAEGPAEAPSAELFKGKVAVFAVPGAFTPTCHNVHLPSFLANADALKAKGVERIVCVSVNDPFVCGAWGDATGATAAGIQVVGDSDAAFTKAIGMEFDGSAVGLGVRSKRYAMLVEDGTVRWLAVEDSPGQAEKTNADAMLAAM
jgi:cytochrome c peroxidase